MTDRLKDAREFTLTDDGTLDTVIEVRCGFCGEEWTERCATDIAAHFRDDSGALDLKALVRDLMLDFDPCPACSA